MTAAPAPAPSPHDDDLDDFSLVVGGPLYHLYVRSRLARPPLYWLRRRLIIFPLVAWLPLFVLSLLAGTALGGVSVPFLYDVGVHAKYLIALPLLIGAEWMVHRVMRPVARQFLERELVRGEDVDRFRNIVSSTLRLRNSMWIELLLIALVYTAGHVAWLQNIPPDAHMWFGSREGQALHLNLAGYWYGFISAPMLQFLLLRWYFRLVVWALFLWRVSRLDLHLVPTHPDQAAGLGFLNEAFYAFGLVPMAQGVMMSSIIAVRIFFFGAKLTMFYGEIAALVAAMAILFLGPLCVFTRQLWDAKRQGIREYGRLGSEYVLEFDRKWLHGGAAKDEPLVGSADIQSLADLSGSFDVVRSMRPTPFSLEQLFYLVLITVAPILPLVLTMIPLEELLKKLVGALF